MFAPSSRPSGPGAAHAGHVGGVGDDDVNDVDDDDDDDDNDDDDDDDDDDDVVCSPLPAVPPALVLPTPDMSVDSAPHSGNDAASAVAEPENRMTSFDFLALCSTPTWLGPERRRSRRRGRSPNPVPQHSKAANDGVRTSHPPPRPPLPPLIIIIIIIITNIYGAPHLPP